MSPGGSIYRFSSIRTCIFGVDLGRCCPTRCLVPRGGDFLTSRCTCFRVPANFTMPSRNCNQPGMYVTAETVTNCERQYSRKDQNYVRYLGRVTLFCSTGLEPLASRECVTLCTPETQKKTLGELILAQRVANRSTLRFRIAR